MTPTARTLNHLRAQGYTVDIVERWIPGANIRRDLFGIGDVLAVKPGEPVLLVQCTSLGNGSSRVAKAKIEPRLRAWLATGSRYEVWEWEQGEKLPRVTVLVPDDLQAVPVAVVPPRKKRKPVERTLFNLPRQSNAAARLAGGTSDNPSKGENAPASQSDGKN